MPIKPIKSTFGFSPRGFLAIKFAQIKSFSAACEALVDLGAWMYRLKPSPFNGQVGAAGAANDEAGGDGDIADGQFRVFNAL